MKKGDKIVALIVICIILISSIGVFSYMKIAQGNHHIAEIKQDGKILKTIDLDKVSGNQVLKIYYDSTHYNTISIEKGRIKITDADCPDKICVKSGWISQAGETIVCLPHKLIIKIQGGTKNIDENVY